MGKSAHGGIKKEEKAEAARAGAASALKTKAEALKSNMMSMEIPSLIAKNAATRLGSEELKASHRGRATSISWSTCSARIALTL